MPSNTMLNIAIFVIGSGALVGFFVQRQKALGVTLQPPIHDKIAQILFVTIRQLGMGNYHLIPIGIKRK